MKREWVRPASNSKIAVACLVVLALAVAVTNLTLAAPLEQGITISLNLSYKLIASPRALYLCTGETYKIQVFLERTVDEIVSADSDTTRAGPTASRQLIFAARISGESSDTSVVDFTTRPGAGPGNSPPNQYSTISGLINVPRAWFVIKAMKPGNATFQFSVDSLPRTERELFRVNVPTNTDSARVDVEVADCYEAYASGFNTGNVANIWIKKNICNLEEPFSLKYAGAGQGGGASFEITSMRAFFNPLTPALLGVSGLQGAHGAYIYIGKGHLRGLGMDIACKYLAGGPYDITWYNTDKTEGDITLEGAFKIICLGRLVQESSPPGILIGIRALDPATITDSCEGH